MTKPSLALSDVLEKGADTDMLRQMIEHVVQRVMEFDIENLCNAGYGKRSAERANRRNGYRERLWETRAGSIPVKIPKLREGIYFPPFLEPRRTAEKALAAVIQKAYVRGRLDALSRRARQGHGHERDLQEPGQSAVRRNR